MPNPSVAEIILLIEDDVGIAELVREILIAEGKQIVHVTTGRAAREWLEHQYPQLILMDYSLPDMSGLELVELLTSLPNGIPPFIVTTGSGDERVAVMMMKRGARDYVIKDLNFLDGLPLVVAQVQKQIATEQQLDQAEKALRESQQNYRQLFESIGDAIIVYDGQSKLLDCNPTALTMYGYSRQEFLALTGADLIHPDYLTKMSAYLPTLLANQVAIAESLHRREDGSTFPVEVSARQIDYHGRNAFLTVVRDIAERKRAEEEAAQKNKQLTMLNHLGQALNKLAAPSEILERSSDFFNMDGGRWMTDLIGQVFDNRNLYIALYDEATNYISFPIYTVAGERKNSVAGRPLSNGLTESVIRTRTPILILDHVDEWLAERGVALIGTPCQCYLGVPILIDDHVIGVIAVQDYEHANVYNASHTELLSTIASQAAIAFANARLYETVQQEFVERRRAEEQLRHMSTHDALTSLYNRMFFESELARLEHGREFPISLAVADVDNMKTTNDKRGHAAGDELLKRAAQVLQSAFRKSDIIARIGGDEFAIIWPQTDVATAARILTRIQQNLIAVNQEHSDLLLQLSIGIATATTNDLAETLKLADARMYEDKRTHKLGK